ncbi:glycoside hydrolase family 27 protein [Xylogone sp. PMI_703]|nr:glycoside hydrolase family 27 protein [Xylogone sp. PMI_703]
MASALLAALLVGASLVAAQVDCDGTQYTPGSRFFTDECYQTVQDCIAQFGANASQIYCQDGPGNLYMEQQPDNGNNNAYQTGFTDILDFCVLDGWTTGTWFSSNQWYWIAAEDGCYSSNATIPTTGPGFCVQNRDDILPSCYPQPEEDTGGPLQVLYTAETANGFKGPGKGWNSWGTQSTPPANPSYTVFNQDFVYKQCSVLGEPAFRGRQYDICSLDAGWSSGDTDEYGRITYNTSLFDLPGLAEDLRHLGVKTGVYIIPGLPCNAANKTIKGTNIKIGDVLIGNNDAIGYCDWDFSKDGVQQWHDSLIELWSSWGISMIKLDFITPGSPQNGANLLCDNSAAVTAFHNAIEKSGKQIRLDLSWKLCRNETTLPFWSGLAESMRTDQDIDNYGGNTFVAWQQVQRAIENYRQYILLQKQRKTAITIYPDMDGLFVANAQNQTGVDDKSRVTIMSHWIGAAANLILGGDMTNVDDLGLKLLTSDSSSAASRFTAQYPMQPRNPGTGNNLAKQLQAWIAGPSPQGEAYVLITNLGPDQGQGGFNTALNGTQAVTVSLADLGIAGKKWSVTDVWNGNKTMVTDSYTAYLDENESQFLQFHAR